MPQTPTPTESPVRPARRLGAVRLPQVLRHMDAERDLLLIGLLLLVVALIVAPLPLVALDVLIVLNFALSLIVMVAAISAPSALALSSYPSMLLFTTLLRLGLNIASTKQILLTAHAPHVIELFGQLSTSSRNKVPSDASSMRPTRAFTAPVYAPTPAPKSSLSIKASGMLVQSTCTKFPGTPDLSWMILASVLLPVPVSPMISTLASLEPASCSNSAVRVSYRIDG